MLRASRGLVLKVQRELGHPKCARKVSGVLRNRLKEIFMFCSDNWFKLSTRPTLGVSYMKEVDNVEIMNAI